VALVIRPTLSDVQRGETTWANVPCKSQQTTTHWNFFVRHVDVDIGEIGVKKSQNMTVAQRQR
jgi:hypothetical protein